MARIEGRTVTPLATLSTGNAKGVYALALGNSVPDIRDKKLRLRLEGNRIVPYYSRAQIERGRIDAPVLAYVADRRCSTRCSCRARARSCCPMA